MFNLDTFLPMYLLVTRFAEAYGEGSYSAGEYNEATSTTTPTQSGSTRTNTTQTSEEPTPSENQQTNSTDEQPRMTTTQTASPQESTTNPATGMDPLWMILIAAGIIIAILATIFAIRKNRHN